MRETTFTELRNHAKTFFDAVEEGETRPRTPQRSAGRGHRSGQGGDASLEEAAPDPALDSLSLGDEVLADRGEKR